MAFDEETGRRLRNVLVEEAAGHGVKIEDRRMFGGLAIMVNGHMCCGTVGPDIVIRVAPDRYEEALSQPHVRPMDFTGRPMRGFVYVDGKGARSSAELKRWIRLSLDFVLSLPSK